MFQLSQYSIGIPEMDSRHEKWIDLIERFQEAAGANLASPEAVAAARTALSELSAYTSWHFSAEEAFMVGIGYPALREHRMMHDRILSAISSLVRDLAADPASPALPLCLRSISAGWLVEHILGEDRKYAAHAAGLPPDPGRPPAP